MRSGSNCEAAVRSQVFRSLNQARLVRQVQLGRPGQGAITFIPKGAFRLPIESAGMEKVPMVIQSRDVIGALSA